MTNSAYLRAINLCSGRHNFITSEPCWNCVDTVVDEFLTTARRETAEKCLELISRSETRLDYSLSDAYRDIRALSTDAKDLIETLRQTHSDFDD